MRLSKPLLSLFASSLFLFSANAWSEATVILINLDAPGVGLNDPTPATPVGGNTGTTIGEQRIQAYLKAADTWAQSLSSDVPIFVGATFTPLDCAPTGGVLGAAGPTSVFGDYPNAGVPGTWHVGALADAQAGFDLDPGFLDIISFFNSDIDDDPNCLTGSNWYYGLDNNNSPDEIDFLTVVTHEINHGLGHLELVDEQTGEAFFGFPDVYMRNLLDLTAGETWENLTNEERLTSQVNTDNLVWQGGEVNSQASMFLGPRGSVKVRGSRSVKGNFEAQPAAFGYPLRNWGFNRFLVLADDGEGVTTDACEPLRGKWWKYLFKTVLVDRGGCPFTTKVANVQAAWGNGAIIANNVPKGRPSMGGSDDSIWIQSVGVSMALGDALKAALADHKRVKVTLKLDRQNMAGTEQGLVRMYAPDPVQPGSSKSHWDTSATPNLLMEPAINDDLESATNLDLSPALLQDIGWTLDNPPLDPPFGASKH